RLETSEDSSFTFVSLDEHNQAGILSRDVLKEDGVKNIHSKHSKHSEPDIASVQRVTKIQTEIQILLVPLIEIRENDKNFIAIVADFKSRFFNEKFTGKKQILDQIEIGEKFIGYLKLQSLIKDDSEQVNDQGAGRGCSSGEKTNKKSVSEGCVVSGRKPYANLQAQLEQFKNDEEGKENKESLRKTDSGIKLNEVGGSNKTKGDGPVIQKEVKCHTVKNSREGGLVVKLSAQIEERTKRRDKYPPDHKRYQHHQSVLKELEKEMDIELEISCSRKYRDSAVKVNVSNEKKSVNKVRTDSAIGNNSDGMNVAREPKNIPADTVGSSRHVYGNSQVVPKGETSSKRQDERCNSENAGKNDVESKKDGPVTMVSEGFKAEAGFIDRNQANNYLENGVAILGMSTDQKNDLYLRVGNHIANDSDDDSINDFDNGPMSMPSMASKASPVVRTPGENTTKNPSTEKMQQPAPNFRDGAEGFPTMVIRNVRMAGGMENDRTAENIIKGHEGLLDTGGVKEVRNRLKIIQAAQRQGSMVQNSTGNPPVFLARADSKQNMTDEKVDQDVYSDRKEESVINPQTSGQLTLSQSEKEMIDQAYYESEGDTEKWKNDLLELFPSRNINQLLEQWKSFDRGQHLGRVGQNHARPGSSTAVGQNQALEPEKQVDLVTLAAWAYRERGGYASDDHESQKLIEKIAGEFNLNKAQSDKFIVCVSDQNHGCNGKVGQVIGQVTIMNDYIFGSDDLSTMVLYNAVKDGL
nr:hypothetical protein [Endozoicomonas sp.]